MHPDVLLTIGHSGLSPGTSAVNGIPECFTMRTWAPSIARAIRMEGYRCKVRHRKEEVSGWEARQFALVAEVEGLSPRLLVDLHHNGGGYPGSTAIFPPGDEASEKAAETLARGMATAIQNRYLGVRNHDDGFGVPRAWSGGEVESPDGKWYPSGSELFLLSRTSSSTLRVILEPYDGTVDQDWQKAMVAFKTGVFQAGLARAVAAVLG